MTSNFDSSKIPRSLKAACQKGSLVLLLGSGISRHVNLNVPDVFPSWAQLLESMRKSLSDMGKLGTTENEEIVQRIKSNSYLDAADYLHKRFTDPRDYEAFMEEKFDPLYTFTLQSPPPDIYNAIFDLNCPLILTTNYDRLIEDSYAYIYRKCMRVYTYRDVVYLNNQIKVGRIKDQTLLFKIHGDILNPGTLIFTFRSYEDLLRDHPDYEFVLQAIFVSRTVLMIGFSGEDYEIQTLLTRIKTKLGGRGTADYLYVPERIGQSIWKDEFKTKYNVHVLDYTPSDGYQEVIDLLKFLKC